MLQHADIWRAIDRLAERHELSPSGLARKAGLSATLFNPSKRASGTRKRWPSTESIAAILKATGSSLDDFVALASPEAQQHRTLPLLDLAEAGSPAHFDDAGRPQGKGWDEISLPGANDPDAFVLELSSRAFEPVFHEGDRLVLSPAQKPRRGDKIALCTRQGTFLIGRLGREGAQKVELLPLSAKLDEPPATLSREEIAWLHRILWASQ
jgi:phage repressor protein C with HTH and peptisase S24 domain